MQLNKRCPECGMQQLAHNKEKGEVYCKNCGLVLDSSGIDFGPEWRSFDDEGQSRRRAGAPLSYTMEDRGLGTSIKNSDIYKTDDKRKYMRLKRWQTRSRTAIERNLRIALSELKRVSSILKLPHYAEEEIARIYTQAAYKGLSTGRSIEGLLAGAIYAVLRMHDIPKTPEEVSEATGVDVKKVFWNYKHISRNLNLKTMPIDPVSYVHRFGSKLDLDPETKAKATKIVLKAKEKHLLSGRSPKGIAAGALYIASKLNEENRTQDEVAKASGVTSVTVRNSYKIFDENLDLKAAVA